MDEVKVFNDCLKRTYSNDYYKPVLDVIYNLVSIYNDYLTILKRNDMLSSDNSENKLIKEYITSLFKLMNRFIRDNNYQSIDSAIKFLDDYVKIPPHAYVDYLELLYYKEDSYNNDNEEFYKMIHELCEIDVTVDSNLFPYEIINYLNEFNSYRVIANKEDKDIDMDKYYIFTYYADKVIAYSYLHNIPYTHLSKMFACIRDNYEAINAYIHQNYSYSKYFQLDCNVINKIIDMCEGNKGIIR